LTSSLLRCKAGWTALPSLVFVASCPCCCWGRVDADEDPVVPLIPAVPTDDEPAPPPPSAFILLFLVCLVEEFECNSPLSALVFNFLNFPCAEDEDNDIGGCKMEYGCGEVTHSVDVAVVE
jgi:hypothetical protein